MDLCMDGFVLGYYILTFEGQVEESDTHCPVLGKCSNVDQMKVIIRRGFAKYVHTL